MRRLRFAVLANLVPATHAPCAEPSIHHILLLEDDPAIAATAAFVLDRDGFKTTHVLLISEAQRLLVAGGFSLAIFDIGLPDGSGLDACRWLRNQAQKPLAELPLLMLTARSEEIDRVLGLEVGADDYITKPFSPRELVARVRALLRRSTMSRDSTASLRAPGQAFEHDEPGQRIAYAGQWLALTRMEYQLLRTLLAVPGRIHSRSALMDGLWGHALETSDRTVDTHIKTLRAKLREHGAGDEVIVTHRGLGYSLLAPTRL